MLGGSVKPGDVLGGKYEVERVLGAGGMGVVVAAKHLDLGQRVALKFMLDEAMADPAHAERFFREARSAVQLKSTHAARVLDVGRLEDGEPFIVMEYLDGRDLDAELQARGPLPPHVAVDYILQVSEALAEAHGLGMVHRDIKPKNLFLTTSVDGRPLVKVLDFGLAKTIGPRARGDVSLTATRSVFGSPQYMSPEQMRSSKEVDSRSDIWSLGVCLYELLTGRLPFDAPGVAEICAMVLKDRAPPPSQHVHGLPGELERVVLRCLQKDVTRRFQSVPELAFALHAYAIDEGAAHRILQVMRSAREGEHRMVGAESPSSADAGETRTMSAWDSALPTRRRPTRPRHVSALVGLALLMGLVGAATITMAVRTRPAPATAIVGSAPSSTPSPPSSAPLDPAPTAGEPPPSAAGAAATSASRPAVLAASDAAPPRHVSPRAPAKTTATTTRSPPPKPRNGPGSGRDYM